MDDLSRMFRLFSKIPRGLEPVSNTFKQVNDLTTSTLPCFPIETIRILCSYFIYLS